MSVSNSLKYSQKNSAIPAMNKDVIFKSDNNNYSYDLNSKIEIPIRYGGGDNSFLDPRQSFLKFQVQNLSTHLTGGAITAVDAYFWRCFRI